MKLKIAKKEKLVQRTFNIKESQLTKIDETALANETNCNEVMRSILDNQFKKES